MITKQTFNISGMHCTSCATTIDMDLEDLEGVEEARTNYAKQFSEVKFETEKVSPEKIIETIKKTGYEVI